MPDVTSRSHLPSSSFVSRPSMQSTSTNSPLSSRPFLRCSCISSSFAHQTSPSAGSVSSNMRSFSLSTSPDLTIVLARTIAQTGRLTVQNLKEAHSPNPSPLPTRHSAWDPRPETLCPTLTLSLSNTILHPSLPPHCAASPRPAKPVLTPSQNPVPTRTRLPKCPYLCQDYIHPMTCPSYDWRAPQDTMSPSPSEMIGDDSRTRDRHPVEASSHLHPGH